MQELQEKIRENTKVSPDTDCWLWQRSVGSHGYGQVSYGKKQHTTHRASYTAFNGEIPKGMIVRHTCDVRSCCNPKHLILGTYRDNTNDAVVRGRIATGERHGSVTLTWGIVREIRETYKGKGAYPDQYTLAEMYGVTQSLISQIVNNRVWKEEHYDNPK